MSQIVRVLVVVLLLFISRVGSAQLRILFLGNSYTYVNDLPNMLKNLASSKGKNIVVSSNLIGGYTLQDHTTNPQTISLIQQGNWDFVVIQEQSQLPAFPPSQTAVDVFPYAKMLVDSIKKYSPCGTPLFYMTWGRRYGDQSNCANYPPICTYEGMSWRLRETYLQLAQQNKSFCAPVGWAWRRSLQDDSTLILHSSDNSHPSTEGSYLAACVFYTSIFQQPSSGATFYNGLTTKTATYLQSVADTVVLDSLPLWKIRKDTVLAQFQYQKNNQQVSFQNLSKNYSGLYWDFGDGSNDTLPNPIHTYMNAGPFLVQLIAKTSCSSDTSRQWLSLNTSTTALNNNDGISFAQGRIQNLSSTKKVVRIGNLLGTNLETQIVLPNAFFDYPSTNQWIWISDGKQTIRVFW